MQDFWPLFAQKVLISKANTYTAHYIHIVSHLLKAHYSAYTMTPPQNSTKKRLVPAVGTSLIIYIRYITSPRKPTRYLLQQPSR